MDERIYQADDGQWYYRARGHQDAGPFESQEQALTALRKQIRDWRGRANPRATWPRTLQPTRFLRRSATRHP